MQDEVAEAKALARDTDDATTRTWNECQLYGIMVPPSLRPLIWSSLAGPAPTDSLAHEWEVGISDVVPPLPHRAA